MPASSPNILSLPDDIILKIFSHLSQTKHTLQTSKNGINLAKTNTRLQQIFSSRLTHITPILENCEAETLEEAHFGELIRMAGTNLRVLHLPDGQHEFVKDLPQMCPRLEELVYLEIHHRRGSEMSPASSSVDGDGDGDDSGQDDVHGDGENGGGDNDNGENGDGGNDDVQDGDGENSDNGSSYLGNGEDGSDDEANHVDHVNGHDENVDGDTADDGNLIAESGDEENSNDDGNDYDGDLDESIASANSDIGINGIEEGDDGNGDDGNILADNLDGENFDEENIDDDNENNDNVGDEEAEAGDGDGENADDESIHNENADDELDEGGNGHDENAHEENDDNENAVEENDDDGGSDNGSDNENNDAEDNGGNSSDNEEYDSDHDIHLSEIATTKHNWTSCAAVPILPRLKLRKLSLTRPPVTFFDTMADHTLQELHLYRIKKHHLAMLLPLLSRPLKALTVTVHGFFQFAEHSATITAFIDGLIPMVSHIASVTLHVPFNPGLGTVIETWDDTFSINLLDKAASLVASARENTCSSDCTKIDLKGDETFRLLAAVNSKAWITLSCGRVTVRDTGTGIHVTGLPLDDEFLDQDVTNLEKAFILRQCRRLEHVCNFEWGRRLAGHRLRVIRTCDARVLNKLRLSTEKLEYFCRGVSDVTDWTFLSGVRELYLLGVPSGFSKKPRHRTLEVIQKLPQMIDAFQGELIWVGLYGYVDCRECPFLDDLVQSANATREAIDRFLRRGGDAGTLQRYVDTVLMNSVKSMKDTSDTT